MEEGEAPKEEIEVPKEDEISMKILETHAYEAFKLVIYQSIYLR